MTVETLKEKRGRGDALRAKMRAALVEYRSELLAHVAGVDAALVLLGGTPASRGGARRGRVAYVALKDVEAAVLTAMTGLRAPLGTAAICDLTYPGYRGRADHGTNYTRVFNALCHMNGERVRRVGKKWELLKPPETTT